MLPFPALSSRCSIRSFLVFPNLELLLMTIMVIPITQFYLLLAGILEPLTNIRILAAVLLGFVIITVFVVVKKVAGKPYPASTQPSVMPAATQSTVMPAATQSTVMRTTMQSSVTTAAGTYNLAAPGRCPAKSLHSSAAAGHYNSSIAALAVRAAHTSKSPDELRTRLMALLGPAEPNAPRPSAMYRARTQYYTANVKVDDGSGVPVRKLQQMAVSATSAGGGLVGHVQYVLAPVTFPGCWRLVLTVASFGDNMVTKAGTKKKMSQGPAAASVGVSELDDAASVLNRRLEVALVAEGASLLQPATFVDQSPVHVLPYPVALPAIAVQSAGSRVQGWCEPKDVSLMLPRGVLVRLGCSGDCLRVVVSLSHGHEPVHEVTWTVEELRDLAADQEGSIQLPLPGLKSQQVVVEPHMLPVLVVSVMQQPRDHSRPDTLLACCPVPVLPPEQCAEMCNIFSTMVAECGDHAIPADVYHDSYLPLVWDLSCALSPGSITAVVEAAGLEAYADSARELLLFLWSQSMWHCLEAAAQQLQVLPDLTTHLVQHGECLAVEREVLQLLQQPDQQVASPHAKQHDGQLMMADIDSGEGVLDPVRPEQQAVGMTALEAGNDDARDMGAAATGTSGAVNDKGGGDRNKGGTDRVLIGPGVAGSWLESEIEEEGKGLRLVLDEQLVAGVDGEEEGIAGAGEGVTTTEMLEYSPSNKPTSEQTHSRGAGAYAWDDVMMSANDATTQEESLQHEDKKQPGQGSGDRGGSNEPPIGAGIGAAGLGDVQMPQPGLDSWVVAAKGALVGWTQSPGWKILESRYQQWLLTQPQMWPKMLMCLDTVSSTMVIHRMVTAIMWEEDIPQTAIPALQVNIMGHALTLARCAIFLLGPRRWWRYRGCITTLLDCAVFTTLFLGLIFVCPLKTQECAMWLVDLSLPAEDRRAKMQVAVVFYVVLRAAMQQVVSPWLLPAGVMCAANVCWIFGGADPEWFWHAVDKNALPGWAAVLLSTAASVGVVVATEGRQRLHFLRSRHKKQE